MAAAAVAIAVAGCGSASTTSSTAAAGAPAAAPAAATPAAASSTFDAALVGATTTKASPRRVRRKSAKSVTGTATTAANASQGLALTSGVTPTTTSPAAETTTAADSTETTTTATSARTTSPKTTPPRTIIKRVPAKPKIKIVTVTEYQPKYITRTVTVAPKVPAGAFLPSTRAALSLTSFKVASGRVGCVIGGGSVRCDVTHQSWTAPAQPASCTQSWGTGIVLVITSQARLPQFACGGGSALRASAKVVQNGFDDTVGAITCQVRGFGVNCFAADKKGFILSPTGYILY